MNGTINFDDFTILSTNFNMMGENWKHGNVNIDDITHFSDFLEISNRWDMTFTSYEKVPEPAVLLSLWCGFSQPNAGPAPPGRH